MNKDQVVAAVKKYSDHLSVAGVKSNRHLELEVKPFNINASAPELLEHARWMCDEIIMLIGKYDEHVEKIMRWLGFVQGVLWSTGTYTIDQMKDDNR